MKKGFFYKAKKLPGMFSLHAAGSFPCTYLLFFFLLSLAKDQDFAEHII